MICGCYFQKEDISNIFSFFKGGPLVTWIPKKDRFYLIGTVSGGFFECSNILPGIFVQVDEISVLNFLRKEIFGDDPIQLGTYSKFTLLRRVGTGKKAEKETLRTIPGETQGFICTSIFRLNRTFYNEEGVISFIN